jgi:hypothetical protein
MWTNHGGLVRNEGKRKPFREKGKPSHPPIIEGKTVALKIAGCLQANLVGLREKGNTNKANDYNYLHGIFHMVY